MRKLKRGIQPHDVMPLLNKIFHKSFGNVAGNKKATADRGWFPPNRKLLEHSCFTAEINSNDSTADPSSCSGTSGSSSELNIYEEDGMVATVLDKMLGDQSRPEGTKIAHEKRKKEGDDAGKNIRDAKRLTTGILTANGIHSLGDAEFLSAFRERQAVRKEKQDKVASVKKAKKKKNVSGVKSMRRKYGHERTHLFREFAANECDVYLHYKKQDKDPGMPKALSEKRLCCREWMHRPSPLLPYPQ